MATTSENPQDTFLASTKLAASNQSVEQNDPAWVHEDIDAARWNQIFPYQLLLVKKTDDGSYVQDSTCRKFTFTLPFPPSALSKQFVFGVEGSMTQGGFVEEFAGNTVNGLAFSGSLGVMPLRPSAPARQTSTLGQSIFAGTIATAQSGLFAAAGAVSSFTENVMTDAQVSSTTGSSDVTDVVKTTGHYQMLLLERFFENFVAFKAKSGNRDYRLACAIWKEQAVFLVTPTAFNLTKDAGSPLEPQYQLQFKVYKRIRISNVNVKSQNVYEPAGRSPSKLAKLVDGLIAARDVLETLRDSIAAVGGDIDQKLFEPLRQATLFCKDALSIPLALVDLPASILQTCSKAVASYAALKESLTGYSDIVNEQGKDVADAYRALAGAGSATSDTTTGSGTLVKSEARQAAEESDPANDVFRHPDEHYTFFKGVNVSSLKLPPVVTRSIVTERERARHLTRLDFERQRDGAAELLADFTDAVGAGNSTFSATYGRRAPARTRTPTPLDFRVIFALNRVVMHYNALAATADINQGQLSSIDFVAGMARAAGVAFRVPKSKYAVPFPYGMSLEQLALRYLGDPDRWLEIAVLNGLRSPYVDEVGFDLPLLVNGSGNEVVVSDASDLYVGQAVWLQAPNATRTARHVVAVDRVSGTNVVVTVDGDSDCERYKSVAGAYLHAYLPDTVNSQMTIFIPSDEDPGQDDFRTRSIPGLDAFDPLFAVAGVDVLLDNNNQIVMTPDGDNRWATGLTAVIQTARIGLSTPQGSLIRHPGFGLPLKVGVSSADTDPSAILKAAKNLFAQDSTFTGVSSASVQKIGPAISINLAVGVVGQNGLLPLSFSLGGA